jgi:hypothetical protein
MKKILLGLLACMSVNVFASIGDNGSKDPNFIKYTFQTKDQEVTVDYKQPVNLIDPTKDAGYISQVILCKNTCRTFNFDETTLPVHTYSNIAAPFSGSLSQNFHISGTIYNAMSKYKPDYDLEVRLNLNTKFDYTSLNDTVYELYLTSIKPVKFVK